ncbi:hypothetical protein BJV78DRAFT_1351550 [Lactifluus subvellereus]|nr:hypothetical protein BJV78DRAFT_1351550 [Lactifluus subvellereus]
MRYGTLNHLNAHIVMQRHGNKRTPAEFKELREQWRSAKKDETERLARLERAEERYAVRSERSSILHNLQPAAQILLLWETAALRLRGTRSTISLLLSVPQQDTHLAWTRRCIPCPCSRNTSDHPTQYESGTPPQPGSTPDIQPNALIQAIRVGVSDLLPRELTPKANFQTSLAVAVPLHLAPHPSIMHVLLNYHHLTLHAPRYFIAHLFTIYALSSSPASCVIRITPEAKSEAMQQQQPPYDNGEMTLEDALLSEPPEDYRASVPHLLEA